VSASTCEDFGAELVAYLDGELPEATRRPVASHVSTCLVCRRELDRLGSVRRWLDELPSIEPSADFAARLWDRLQNEDESVAPLRRRRSRAMLWAIPPLAAAAALVVAFRLSVSPPPPAPVSRGSVATIAGGQPPARRQQAVAQANGEHRSGDAAPQVVAGAGDGLPDDLPPDLLDRPELFLRLPVVRRLDKLEHFEEVRQPEQEHDDDTIGRAGERLDGVV